jgi:hypothetical protein
VYQEEGWMMDKKPRDFSSGISVPLRKRETKNIYLHALAPVEYNVYDVEHWWRICKMSATCADCAVYTSSSPHQHCLQPEPGQY